ncbi:MAG: flagellar hook-basal body complex protein FliE [Alphaproteobacteria bacterium]|nr:flagellar hook-basal body complex protein FliE [Alphaproteobacteria bacterium]
MAIPVAAQAAQAYSAAGNIGGGGMEPRVNAPAGAGGFADMVKTAAGDAVQTLQQGEAASAAAISGGGNLTEVVTAVSNAETMLQTVVAVRDRVIQAYQDILRMPI